MATVVGIRFKHAGKIYYFDPANFDLNVGDHAIVETVRGVEYGDVVLGKREVPESEVVKPLKKVIKKADDVDARKVAENKAKEKEAFEICNQKIAKRQMDMKLISVEYTFDCNKIIFYFTANGRVDFRELVKDLASVFKARIELRQIGVRDEAKMLGGLGPCGRCACCASFMGDFQPVSIKMAKEQSLSLSPTKISGLCGRLMCCLNYEQQYYESVVNLLPRVGDEVKTPDGKGNIIEVNALSQTVKVKLLLSDGDVEAREYAVSDVKINKKRRGPIRQEKITEDVKGLID